MIEERLAPTSDPRWLADALGPDSEIESGTKPAKDTPVTVNFPEVSFKNALALVLSAVGCTATIEGETIVVRRQE